MGLPSPTLASAITRLTTGTALASASHTPTTGDTLIAVAYAHTAGGTNFTDTATCAGNGQTWTKRGAALSADGKQYLSTFTAGPVAAPTTTATTITVNTSVTEALVCVYRFAKTTSNTVEPTAPYVNSAAAAAAAATSHTVTLTPLADATNGVVVVFGHLADELTTPRASWTELGDANSAPNTNTIITLEGQYLVPATEQTVSASWATSSVSIYAYVEVKNGKVWSPGGAGQASGDLTDTSVLAGNADSGWNAGGPRTFTPVPTYDRGDAVHVGFDDEDTGGTPETQGYW